jgi:hypothetical protein
MSILVACVGCFVSATSHLIVERALLIHFFLVVVALFLKVIVATVA